MARQVLAVAGVCVVLASCATPVPSFDIDDWRSIDASVGVDQPRPYETSIDPMRVTLRYPSFVATDNARTPPAISGGTLTVLRDGHTAVAADPDLDAVWIVNLDDYTSRRVSLHEGDEPGRVVEGPDGQVFVALRRADAVAVIDVASAAVTARRAACHAPRGVAWDASASLLRVACADGTLMALGPSGEVRERMNITPDLRDVVMIGGDVFVSTLRWASLYRVRGGAITRLPTPGTAALPRSTRDTAVAWRTTVAAGRVVMLAEHAVTTELDDSATGRGYAPSDWATGAGPVIPGVAFYDPNAAGLGADPPRPSEVLTLTPVAALAVDVAVTSTPAPAFAVASPGWAFGQGPAQVNVFTAPDASTPSGLINEAAPTRSVAIGVAQAVAVAFTPRGLLVTQTRAPSGVVIERDDHTTLRMVFSETDTRNSGHDAFHAVTLTGLACATCHPEGGDDGRTWRFHLAGARRTPSLGGDITQTAPFQWDGSLIDMRALISAVFSRGMRGGSLQLTQTDALARWIDAMPAGPTRPRSDASDRGEALFDSTEVGCSACHSGSQHTDNRAADVGTGATYQVPRLVGLATRAPYMHNGCALTLRASLTDADCGGGDRHGRTSQLTSAQLDDLVAYLETL